VLLTEASAPITFVGGKGGVGKTTVAAAYALRLADAGFRTLLMSTDPAHSVGDVLQRSLGDQPQKVVERLWAREPDAARAVRRRIAEVADDAHAVVPREIMPAVRRHLEHAAAGPGMVESALADQLVDAMDSVPASWDRLVVDSAPTGHLLRMMNLPELLTPWVHGLARQRERAVRADRFATAVAGSAVERSDDPLLEKLHERRRRLEWATRRLRADCLVLLVVLPRRMVLAETGRAAQQLEGSEFRLGPVVINQISAGSDPDSLAAARRRFGGYGVHEIAHQSHEPIGLDALRAIAAQIG
jgi:arsenite/tail-anchored protein-transporting ATPase